jgi:hypothetical protein
MQLGSLCEDLERAGRSSSDSACHALAELVIQGFEAAQTCIKARKR